MGGWRAREDLLHDGSSFAGMASGLSWRRTTTAGAGRTAAVGSEEAAGAGSEPARPQVGAARRDEAAGSPAGLPLTPAGCHPGSPEGTPPLPPKCVGRASESGVETLRGGDVARALRERWEMNSA